MIATEIGRSELLQAHPCKSDCHFHPITTPATAPIAAPLAISTAFETIDSVGELQEAVDDPVAFVEKLAKASGPAAKKLAIMRLKPKLEPPT